MSEYQQVVRWLKWTFAGIVTVAVLIVAHWVFGH